MENKAKIVENRGAYKYYDSEGNILHDGDTIRYSDGRTEKLYLTVDGLLGTDATNPVWIKNGRAVPCEYGVYPLDIQDLRESVKVDEE